MRIGKVAGCLALLGWLFVACTSVALADDTEARHTLAPTGKLRAALYPGTPTSILKDEGANSRGVGFEIGKALAARLGVPYEPVVLPNNAAVQAAIKAGDTDVAFTNASAERAKVVDFGPTYLDIELGYLVSSSSPIKAIADVDAPGRRIGVAAGSTSESTLKREFKNAEVVPAPTNAAGLALLKEGKIDAFATNKATLFELGDTLAGSKVLDGQWGLERHAIAIPKGRDQGLPLLRTFTEAIKADGLVAAAITRAGLRGAKVAPPQ
jgi:polar amino acid transport system substrate-binding protein